MFNVLCWNIQFFTLRRVFDNSGATQQAVADNLERTLANSHYIISTVLESGADIFVVLEPRCGQGTVERLAPGGGPDGLLLLLAQLRLLMPARNWCLVPPLRLNPRDHVGQISTYTECIGVFWSDANLAFTGPKLWPAGAANASGPPIAPGAGGGNYPAPWDQAVPAGVQAAAQCRFYDNGNEILFPNEYNRRPFYTTFLERNPPGRTLRLFAVHTTPPGQNSRSTARDGFARIFGIPERTPGANEVSLIIGDINVNLNNQNYNDSAAVRNLPTLEGFNRLWPGAGPDYDATRIMARDGATPAEYLTTQSLDYGYVRWGPGAAPLLHFLNAVDRVVPVPSPPFNGAMAHPLGVLANIANAAIRDMYFRWRWNYGRIAQPRRNNPEDDAPGDGTSDHIPILVSV